MQSTPLSSRRTQNAHLRCAAGTGTPGIPGKGCRLHDSGGRCAGLSPTMPRSVRRGCCLRRFSTGYYGAVARSRQGKRGRWRSGWWKSHSGNDLTRGLPSPRARRLSVKRGQARGPAPTFCVVRPILRAAAIVRPGRVKKRGGRRGFVRFLFGFFEGACR